MLKRFNQVRICCPVNVYEEINAFWKQKDPKITKTKTSRFLRFRAIFVKFSLDFVNCNVGKGQQRRNVLSVGFSEEFIEVFW